eukprot:9002394-Alexandrium_andersonii.AAC.1
MLFKCGSDRAQRSHTGHPSNTSMTSDGKGDGPRSLSNLDGLNVKMPLPKSLLDDGAREDW